MPIEIAASDIDFMGHVDNASYLAWVQAAVLSRWRRFAPPAAIMDHLWAALKHEINYRRPIFLNDVVAADVLLERIEGARAFYMTTIRRDEAAAAEVRSSWCCLDAATKRPVRPARSIVDIFFNRRSDVAPSAIIMER